MQRIASRVWIWIACGLIACGDDSAPDSSLFDASSSDAQMDGGPTDAGVDSALGDAGPTEFVFTEPPIDPGVPVRFATIPYGPHRSQLMDVWLPTTDAPTAVVIFYHGGGFVGGSRESAHGGTAAMLRAVLEAGIAWVGVDYRFVTDSTANGVIGSLSDCRRALQFVRFHATALDIDPGRVGLTGGSAGAGTSLWLATHDDMADPSSDDPVERMSTRVSVATVYETQATYDLLRWPPDVYSPMYPMTAEDLLADIGNAAQAAVFYGLPITLANDPDALLEAVTTEEMTAYRADIDMLAWMSSDDPPIYVYNSGPNAAPGERGFDLLHHPLHAMAVRARAMEVGVMIDAEIPAFDVHTEIGTVEHLESQLSP